MPVPKYYEMYRPFLDSLKDRKEHTLKDVKEYVSKVILLSSDDLKELLPSGNVLYDNRIGWTRTFLKKAGLIESPKRGVFLLTKEGVDLLIENPAVINDNFLRRYESFELFYNSDNSQTKTSSINSTEDTPQDELDKAFKKISAALEDELLSEIMKQTPIFFEYLVVKLLEKMGYGGSLGNAGTVTKQSGDEGIDGIIREDKLGFNKIYIQAKRWDLNTTISRPEIQKFVGALAGQGASKGLFITTAQFTKEAQAYADKQHTTKVVLVDGNMLVKYMIEYQLGVSTEAVYEIKKIDTDFFNIN